MKSGPTNPTPPVGYPICTSETCPRRSHCLRSQIAERLLSEQAVIPVINPHHPDYHEGDDCPYYRPASPERYARGFKRGLSGIPSGSYTPCTRHLMALTSKSRFYRQRSGEEPISPEWQEQVLAILRSYGYRGEAEEAFDRYEERYSW